MCTFWPSTDHDQIVIKKSNLLYFQWFIGSLKGATCEKEWFVFYEQYKAIWTIVSFVFFNYQKTIYILVLNVKSFGQKTHLIASHLIVPFIFEIVDCI